MHKKAAVELSMNFLVVVILSIVVLTSGILITRQIFTGAEEIKTQLDSQTDSQIESLLQGSRRVGIAFGRKTIAAEDSSVFGLGVRNVLRENLYFKVSVVPTKIIESGSENPITLTELEAKGWQLLYDGTPNLIKNNELFKFPISVRAGKSAQGSVIIFDVNVYYGNTKDSQTASYGTPEKFYVTVG